MISRRKYVSTLICLLTLLSISAFAQNARPESTSTQEQATNANSSDGVANEIALLRKSVQTLNSSLRDIGAKLEAPGAKSKDSASASRSTISTNLTLLTQVEQRAEMLRKQLIELMEKETAMKTRLVQIEEDMRPENIERAMSAMGGTRTAELRDARRRILENERKGLDNVLNQIALSRMRLQDDVKDADALVTKLRDRLLPLIDKEIDKISPDQAP
jgi:hypothetical protein